MGFNLENWLERAEKQRLKELNASEELMQKYFEEKRKKRIANTDIMHMSWEQAHEMNDDLEERRESQFMKSNQAIRKANDDPNASIPHPADTQAEIMNLLSQCTIAASKNRPDLINDFEKLGKLLKQSGLGQVSKPQDTSEDEEEIKSEPPVSVSKSWNMIEICKSDPNLIQGIASCEILDKQNHFLSMAVLKRALPSYLAHASVLLQHKNIPIGKIVKHEFRKVNGKDALWIQARLYPEDRDAIQRMIADGVMKGFSIAGTAYLKDECRANSCYQNIEKLILREISLVEQPANELSRLEV